MPNRSRNSSQKLTISLGTLGAILIGVGILFVFWKFRMRVSQLPASARFAILMSGLVLSLFGFIQGLRGKLLIRPELRQSTVRRRTQQTHIFLGQIWRAVPWKGIMLALFGIGFVIFLQLKRFSETFTVLGIVVGLLLVAVGLILAGNRLLSPQERHRQPVRHRISLPIPGVIFLLMMSLLFIGTLQGHSNMMMLVFCLMVGTFVLNGWVTFSMLKNTKVARDLPRNAIAGRNFSVEITLENNKRFLSNWLMDVTDRIEGYGDVIETGVLFSRVPPRQKTSGYYELRLMHRGEYRFGPITASTRFPLGFVDRGLEHSSYDELLVYPRLGRLSNLWKRDMMTIAELAETRVSQRGVYDDEFHHIREYRAGDNPRAIHWRTSARKNELMVREFYQNREPDLVVYLDLWISEFPSEMELDEIENAVGFAATLCVEQMNRSRESVVKIYCSGDGHKRWEGQASPMSYDSVLSMLAVFEAGSSQSLGRILEEGASKKNLGDFSILITTRSRKNVDAEISASTVLSVKNVSNLKIVSSEDGDLKRYCHFE